MKRITIVGNGPIAENSGHFIDGSDVVVRFNSCPSYNKGSGIKVDYLSICNTGWNGHQFGCTDDRLNFDPILKAKKIFFTTQPQFRVLSLIGRNFINHNFSEYSFDIIKKFSITKDRIIYFRRDQLRCLRKKLACFGVFYGISPSSGAVVLDYFIHNPEYMNYRIYLYGFTFSGWFGHPWLLEERLVNYYAERGRVVLAKADLVKAEEVRQP